MLSEIATRVMRDKNEKIAALEGEVKRLRVSLDEYVKLDRAGLVGNWPDPADLIETVKERIAHPKIVEVDSDTFEPVDS